MTATILTAYGAVALFVAGYALYHEVLRGRRELLFRAGDHLLLTTGAVVVGALWGVFFLGWVVQGTRHLATRGVPAYRVAVGLIPRGVHAHS